jgi:dTDP-4-amino-4,6-dideoxygalactose transaminase
VTTATERIPLVDLSWQHREIERELMPRLADMMARGQFILGSAVADFEGEFARFSGSPYCVGMSNGTDALEMVIRAAGLGSGDEVLVPANTFIASVEAIVRAGASPRVVDCDADTYLIDPDRLADAVTPRTRAIMPVHLYGQIAPMERIQEVADAWDLIAIEDAAQCQGAMRNTRGPGAWGVAAATSFYPGKNLGAYGDAGAVLTRDADFAARIRLLRDHGSARKYEHVQLGYNTRLDAIQAAVLRAKLDHLAEWNGLRCAAATRYDELLGDVGELVLPRTLNGNENVWHLYVVRVPHRDAVLSKMHADGVEVAIHYPVPVHLQPALGFLGHRSGDFPVAERAAREVLSLPIYPGITAAQQERVVASLRRALA